MLTIIGALCTALLSGVVAALATYSMSSNKEHVFHLREKAEDLFISLEKYFNILTGYTSIHYSLFKGDLSVLDIMDYIIKQNKNDVFDTESGKRTKMIIAIYFPELERDYDALMHRLGAINKIIADGNAQAEKNGGKLPFDPRRFAQYDNNVKELIAAKTRLSAAIVRSARLATSREALEAPLISALKRRIKSTRAVSMDG